MLCTTLIMLDSLVSLVQCTYTNSGFLATVFAYTALKILEPGSLTSPTTKGAPFTKARESSTLLTNGKLMYPVPLRCRTLRSSYAPYSLPRITIGSKRYTFRCAGIVPTPPYGFEPRSRTTDVLPTKSIDLGEHLVGAIPIVPYVNPQDLHPAVDLQDRRYFPDCFQRTHSP